MMGRRNAAGQLPINCPFEEWNVNTTFRQEYGEIYIFASYFQTENDGQGGLMNVVLQPQDNSLSALQITLSKA
ncbi:hypothetical protein AA0313_1191 [Acetobacter indonesiensis NRIC 0313]|nr:hypothetical protein AA0313_1191 [Acetobacter indonesiensis NRIC 0313]